MNARLRAKRNFWMQTGALLLLAAVVAAAYIRSATAPIDREDLAVETADLRSLCSAGAELGNQFASGKLTDTFFYEQLELMHDKVSSAREQLDASNTGTKIPTELDKARKLAERVDAGFDRLSTEENTTHPGIQELTNLIAPLKQLEDALKQGADN